jgi:hypothetical protein
VDIEMGTTLTYQSKHCNGENNIPNCSACQAENEMPYKYCCLSECGEHEFCRGCGKGIYLKNK